MTIQSNAKKRKFMPYIKPVILQSIVASNIANCVIHTRCMLT